MPVSWKKDESKRRTGHFARMMKKSRVAIILSNLEAGGVQAISLKLAAGLKSKGLDIDLVLVNRQGKLRDAVPDDIRIVDLGARRALQAVFPLARYLEKWKPETIIAGQAHINVSALLANRLAGGHSQSVVVEHNSLSGVARHSPRLVDRTRPALIRNFYPWADQVVAVSQGVADELSSLAGISANAIEVIYNPIVDSSILEKAREKPAHPWADDKSVPFLVAAGRLSAQKDFSTLLKAFSILRKKQEIRLFLFGEGEERGKLEAMLGTLGIEKDVVLPGYEANLYAYMKRSAAFVMSSKWEGLPTVLVEALACGSQVVSTDCPSGPAEILVDGKFGFLSPVGDPEKLAQSVLKAIKEPISNKLLQGRASDFGVEKAVDHYYKLLDIADDKGKNG